MLSSDPIFYMKKSAIFFCFLCFTFIGRGQLKSEHGLLTVKTSNGLLKGTGESGITTFKGVPYAQAPVGDLRWKEPQPAKNWEGTRNADHFLPQEPCNLAYTVIWCSGQME